MSQPPADTQAPNLPFDRDHPWWGNFPLAVGMCRRWRLGPLTFWVQRLAFEWRLAHMVNDDQVAYEAGVIDADEDLTLLPGMQRHCLADDVTGIHIMPALADRPIISKPEKPLFIPSGEEVTLFMAFPLWLRLDAGTPRRPLKDLPTVRLSDTWYGSSIQEGGLCYASRNFGRLVIDELARRPHRVTTAVVLHNRSPEPLYVDRLNVPLPNLSLYQDASGCLWTERVRLERRENETGLHLEVGRGLPSEAEDARLIALPRHGPRRNALARALGNLLSLTQAPTPND